MKFKKVLVTGGAGFIGSYLIKYWLATDKAVQIVNLDKLTYCGDLSRLKTIKNNPRYRFVNADVCDVKAVSKAMQGCDAVIHAAAETHVDRSLLSGIDFMQTNVVGSYVLLEQAKKNAVKKFLYVSTDEVYGSRDRGYFKETDAYHPSSPYSVSKASGDMLALSYAEAYHMPVVVTRGANTYGPYQYPEKVIPLFVSNALSDTFLPLYGDGRQIRNWIHVEDHCRGILTALCKGTPGQAYNISSGDYMQNIDLTKRILKVLGKNESLIKKVADRVAHDKRYAIDNSKIRKLGWGIRTDFDKQLDQVILWYRDNRSWWQAIKDKSADYQAYYKKAYAGRS